MVGTITVTCLIRKRKAIGVLLYACAPDCLGVCQTSGQPKDVGAARSLTPVAYNADGGAAAFCSCTEANYTAVTSVFCQLTDYAQPRGNVTARHLILKALTSLRLLGTSS